MMKQTIVEIKHLYLDINFRTTSKSDNFEKFFQMLQQQKAKLKNNYQFILTTLFLTGKCLMVLSKQQWVELLNWILLEFGQKIKQFTLEIPINFQWKQSDFYLWQKFGINRLVWKFNSKLTKTSIVDCYDMITIAKQSGLKNFSLDYQLTTQTNITKFLSQHQVKWNQLKPPHFSFNYPIATFDLTNSLIGAWLKQNQYQNYEFFSYAQEVVNWSQQTMAYLMLKNWIGLGSKATSFLKSKEGIIISQTSKYQLTRSQSRRITTIEYYQLLLLQGLTIKHGIILINGAKKAFLFYAKPLNQLISNKQLIIEKNQLKVNLNVNTNWWSVLKIINELKSD